MRESDRQRPLAVKHDGRWRRVLSIDDLQSVDEEWWRDRPIQRMYYRVTLEAVGNITVFRDVLDGRWYQQNA